MATKDGPQSYIVITSLASRSTWSIFTPIVGKDLVVEV